MDQISIDRLAKSIGYVAFGSGTESEAPDLQSMTEKAARVVLSCEIDRRSRVVDLGATPDSSERIRAELAWWIGGLEEYFEERLASPVILGTVTIRDRIDTLRSYVRELIYKDNKIDAALMESDPSSGVAGLEDLYTDLSIELDELARYAIAFSVALVLAIHRPPVAKEAPK